MFREADFARPKFLSGEETLTSAQKGTAVHAVLENIDFSTEYTPQSIAELILSLRERGLLSDKEAESINVKKIMVFLESRLCRRMRESGKVYKETPFAMEMTPFEIFGKEEYKKYNEAILVHGMIDCFFVENDSLVLVDYKTDYVRHGEEHKLKEKYYIQLGLYKRALEKSYGMPVSQTCIFSLSTGNEIVF